VLEGGRSLNDCILHHPRAADSRAGRRPAQQLGAVAAANLDEVSVWVETAECWASVFRIDFLKRDAFFLDARAQSLEIDLQEIDTDRTRRVERVLLIAVA